MSSEVDFGPLTGRDVHVWLLDPRQLAEGDARAAARERLSPDEIARAARFMFDADRDAFISARALARTVLAFHAGVRPSDITFTANEYGKLRLAHPALAPELTFNISHTREVVACAVTRGRAVGVDVETVRPAPLDLVQRYFAPPEIDALRRLPPDAQQDAFFAIWTLKESFIKAIGMGLSMPLDRFAVRWSPPALLPYGDFEGRHTEWTMHLETPRQDFRLAACVAVSDRAGTTFNTRWTPQPRGFFA